MYPEWEQLYLSQSIMPTWIFTFLHNKCSESLNQYQYTGTKEYKSKYQKQINSKHLSLYQIGNVHLMKQLLKEGHKYELLDSRLPKSDWPPALAAFVWFFVSNVKDETLKFRINYLLHSTKSKQWSSFSSAQFIQLHIYISCIMVFLCFLQILYNKCRMNLILLFGIILCICMFQCFSM